MTADAYFGLDFYAPGFFPTWSRTFERQEVLDEALTWAARNGQCETMAALVALGADPTIVDGEHGARQPAGRNMAAQPMHSRY